MGLSKRLLLLSDSPTCERGRFCKASQAHEKIRDVSDATASHESQVCRGAPKVGCSSVG